MRKVRAFVPKMTLRRAVSAVVPMCALTALEACKSHRNEIVLAMMAFDAAVDNPPIALAVMAFDAATDPPPGVIVLAAMAFDSGIDHATEAGAPRPRRRH